MAAVEVDAKVAVASAKLGAGKGLTTREVSGRYPRATGARAPSTWPPTSGGRRVRRSQ